MAWPVATSAGRRFRSAAAEACRLHFRRIHRNSSRAGETGIVDCLTGSVAELRETKAGPHGRTGARPVELSGTGRRLQTIAYAVPPASFHPRQMLAHHRNDLI